MVTKKLMRMLALLFAITLLASACSDDGGDDETGTTNAAGEIDGGTDGGTDDDDKPSGRNAIVQERGKLECGVNGAQTGFSETQPDATTTGFDVDFCHAIAAAVFGDAEAVTFTPLNADTRFDDLKKTDATDGIDVLFRNTTHTMARDGLNLDFGPTTYYDGQKIMARASDGFSETSTLADIGNDATLCITGETTTYNNYNAQAAEAGITKVAQSFTKGDDMRDGFLNGTCDLISADLSALVGDRNKLQPDGEEWVIFPEQPMSKEPLGPVYRENDSEWADIVDWVVYVTMEAEELGITSENVDELKDDGTIFQTQLLNLDSGFQESLQLGPDAFYNVIKQVGNYGEIFERNLVPVGLEREGGPNVSWKDGGQIYSPPQGIS